MGRLVVSAAFSIGLSFLGVPSSVGWLIGSFIGLILFPQKGTQQFGPRLGDLTVTASTYGQPITLAFGTIRINGNIIWSTGLIEEENVENFGGKGFLTPSNTLTTYTYFSSFAVGLAEGPADDLLRIWADGKLIYDKTGKNLDVSVPELAFRFYNGSETQVPDTAYEADIVLVTGNSNATPAHRGLAYIVFERFDLSNFANRIPNITCEVTFQAVDSFPIDQMVFISGGLDETPATLWYDPAHNRIYWEDLVGPTEGLSQADSITFTETREQLEADMFPSPSRTLGNFVTTTPDSIGYIFTGASGASIVRVDPNSLTEVDFFGTSGVGLNFTSTLFGSLAPGFSSWVRAISPTLGDVYFLLCIGGGTSAPIHVGVVEVNGMKYVWDSQTVVHAIESDTEIEGSVFGKTTSSIAEGWVISRVSHTSLNIWKIKVQHNAGFENGASIGVQLDLIENITATTIFTLVDNTSTTFHSGASTGGTPTSFVVYDQTDDSLLFRVAPTDDSTTQYLVKWREDDGVLWVSLLPATPVGAGIGINQSILEHGTFAYLDSSIVHTYNTATGDVVITAGSNWPTVSMSNTGVGMVYDSNGDVLMYPNNPPAEMNRVYLNRRTGQGVTLGSIITKISEKSNLVKKDLNVTAATDLVPGYAIAAQATGRQIIELLTLVYFFDLVESEYFMKFVLRGRAVDGTILEKDLAVLDNDTGEFIKENRTQELELPERFNVVYMDPSLDYQQGTQFAKRSVEPVPTMFSRNELGVNIPAAFSAQFAKRAAEKALYSAWKERLNFDIKTSWKFLKHDPTDVLDITLDNGTNFRSRIAKFDVGADFSIDVSTLSEETAQYSSTVLSDGGQGVPDQQIPSAIATKLHLMDMPFLRDEDDVGRGTSRLHYAMADYGSNWPGAGLWKSTDGSIYNFVSQSFNEVTWGTTSDVLGDTSNPFTNDETNSVTVFLTTGAALSSVTQLAMVNGANPAVLINSSGAIEIFQFRDVVANSNGSFTLSGLLRGRRGTESFTGGHAAGETFVFLATTTLRFVDMGLGEILASRSFKAVTFGTLFESAPVTAIISQGRDLKPYAPVNATAIEDGSNNIDFAWERRTRVGGELKDGGGTVPLSEDIEEYELEILDQPSPGETVLRTFTSITSPVKEYLNADIITDFGSVPATIDIRIYQVSAQVGRGFTLEHNLDVQ